MGEAIGVQGAREWAAGPCPDPRRTGSQVQSPAHSGAWRGDQARDTGTGSVARGGGLRLLPSASALTYLETVVKAWRKEGS